MENMVCGQIIAGQVGKILIREKKGKKIELGDLLVIDEGEGRILLQVYDLMYGSQISRAAREQISGMKLEGFGGSLDFLDPELRNYVLAEAKAVLRITEKPHSPKTLPDFFGTVRNVTAKDLEFLTDKKQSPLFAGNVRSGSKVIDVPVYLEALEVIPHHVLVCSTTGRGKSNLVKNMLWSTIGNNQIGILVLDPHDEYYGVKAIGLKDHPKAQNNVAYYSINPPPGTNSLLINLRSLRFEHFEGIVDFSPAQEQVMRDYVRAFQDRWIENILHGNTIPNVNVNTATMGVLQRIFRSKLSVYVNDQNEIVCRNRIFSAGDEGQSTVEDIVNRIEEGKIVIVDTSKSGDEAELLIGSMIAKELMSRHEDAKADGSLEQTLPVGIVIEEAPRVLAKERIEKAGDNIYSTIAKEGRKFKVGLLAITQLVSVIPPEILTNMNTKIILGNEMASERNVIMQSSAQDLSDDNRNIASLDKGEAIVSSIFTKFAVPIKIPLFEEVAKPKSKAKEKVEYTG